MWKLHDLVKSVAWQEALQEGEEVGLKKGIVRGREEAKQELAKKLLAEGKRLKDLALLLDVSIYQVRKWTRKLSDKKTIREKTFEDR